MVFFQMSGNIEQQRFYMKINEIITETTAGAIASVAMPMGKVIKRPNPSVFSKKKKKTNEEIRPEKPNKSSEEYIAMGHAPDSDKVQRAKEYEEWAERQRAKGKDVDEDVTKANFGGVIYPRLPHEEVLDAISSWEYGDTPIELSNGYVINAREEGYNDDDNAWVLLDPQGKMVDHGEGSIEDVMQEFTPIAIDEGKSPHKKGTKKYKKHMAAMHAGMGK